MKIKKICLMLFIGLFILGNTCSVNAASLDGDAAVAAKNEEYNEAKVAYENAVKSQNEKVEEATQKVTEAKTLFSEIGVNFMNEKIKEFQGKGITSAMTSDQWLSYLNTCTYVKEGHSLDSDFQNSFSDCLSYDSLVISAKMAIKQNECRQDTTNLANGELSEQKLSYAKIMFAIVSNCFNNRNINEVHDFSISEDSQTSNTKIHNENWVSGNDVYTAFMVWYTLEKNCYDKYGSYKTATGHYENICSNYPSVGFGSNSKGTTMNSGTLDGTEVTPEEFLSELNSYAGDKKTILDDAKNNLLKVKTEEQKKVDAAYEKLQILEREVNIFKKTGGHTITTKRGYSATVFKTGLTDSQVCVVCGKVINQATVIPKLTPTITLSKTSVTLKKKKSTTIKVSNLAHGDSVKSWKSSNKKIATVSQSGKIKAKKKGKCTITVMLSSGKTTTIKVKVK